jgi:hypothetical protein
MTYTPEALFDCVAKIVAHPHTVITDHDKARAMAIFLTFSDYLGNYTESDNNGGHYVYESDYTDFEGFVMEKLGNQDYKKEVSVEELLK